MKRHVLSRIALCILMLWATMPNVSTYAAPMFQQGVPTGASLVQQTATHADACTPVSSEASATATTTITITPGTTGYIYINELDISNIVGAAAVTAATTSQVTTTNLPNSLAWTLPSGTTAGSVTGWYSVNYGPGGMRSSTPGTNVTFVLPQLKVNQGIHFNACYVAP